MFRKGEIFLSRYRIRCLLGRGVSAQVWFAESLEKPTERVAIKIAQASFPILSYRELNGHLEREGHLLREYPFPNAPRFVEDGVWKGRHYIVMEYVPGITLECRMRRKPQRTVAEALAFFLPLLEAFVALHDRGLIHRDMKPANIMCTPRRGQEMRIAVVDFTISWHAARPSQVCSNQGCAGYSSVEQLRGEEPVPRHDLFALAVMFYELLSGNLHPSGATFDRAVPTWWFLNSAVIPLASVRPELPSPLVAVAHQALDTKPERRYQSAAEFLAAIRGATTP